MRHAPICLGINWKTADENLKVAKRDEKRGLKVELFEIEKVEDQVVRTIALKRRIVITLLV